MIWGEEEIGLHTVLLVVTLFLFGVLLAGCTKYIRDEATDPRDLMTPTADQTAKGGAQPLSLTPPPAPASVLTPRPAVWRAWVPRKEQPNGDVRAGYALDIALDAPVTEQVPPLHPIPLAPLFTVPKANQGTPAGPAQPSRAPAPKPQPASLPGLPPGWPFAGQGSGGVPVPPGVQGAE